MNSCHAFTRLCLAAGLMLAGAAAFAEEEDSPGVTRITKPRSPAAVPVQQTGFDVMPAAPAAEPQSAAPQPDSSSTPYRYVSDVAYPEYHGGGNFLYGPAQGETFVIEDGDCNCRKCRKFRKQHREDCDFDDCEDCKHGGKGGHGDMCNYFLCKFGYFIPTGHGGAGSPFFGHYARVYPQDVNHFDQRDGQMYSAQGYGVPVAVPLAPVVGHTYNYGWGVPSSRLTPISNVAPR